MAIVSRPATDDYRKNFPFPDRKPEPPEPRSGINATEASFIVAPSLAEARQRYFARLGRGGDSTLEEAESSKMEKSDAVWRITLLIDEIVK